MKIIIDDQYFIKTDRLNYILKEKRMSKKNPGEESVRTIGYFGDLEHLSERYLEERQKAAGEQSAVDLMEYVKLVKESNKMAVSSLYDALRAYPAKG